MNGTSFRITGALRTAPPGEGRTCTLPLRSLGRAGATMNAIARALALTASGPMRLSLSDIRIAGAAINQDQCDQP
jgi:hypothetical protein